MKQFLDGLSSVETTLLVLAITATLGFVVPYVLKLLKKATEEVQGKTQNRFLQTVVGLVSDTAKAVVERLNQEVVDGLKEKSADGKLTMEEIKEIQDKAVNILLSTLSEEAKTAIAVVFGDVKTFLTLLLDSKVEEVKREKKALDNELPMYFPTLEHTVDLDEEEEPKA